MRVPGPGQKELEMPHGGFSTCRGFSGTLFPSPRRDDSLVCVKNVYDGVSKYIPPRTRSSATRSAKRFVSIVLRIEMDVSRKLNERKIEKA